MHALILALPLFAMARQRINLLGPIPPPIGGIAIHVETLVRLLRGDGFTCTVFDYTKRPSFSSLRSCGNALRNLSAVILQSLAPNAVLHVHVSYGRRFAWIAPLVGIMAMVKPVVISAHSGSFPSEISGMSRWRRRFIGSAFRRARYVIATNTAIRRALIDHLTVNAASVVVISPFLGTGRALHLAERRARSIIASGYCTALYGWLDLVKAMRSSSTVSSVDLVMYNIIDEPYLAQLRQEISDDTRFRIHFNLSRTEFLTKLLASEVFVRPTYADGDSIALREALENGCKVLASDCVSRPDGVELFKTGDISELREFVDVLLARKPSVLDSRDSGKESYEALKGIYASVE
jgi:glycosyltransferase involved in cell wall biosynthesis